MGAATPAVLVLRSGLIKGKIQRAKLGTQLNGKIAKRWRETRGTGNVFAIFYVLFFFFLIYIFFFFLKCSVLSVCEYGGWGGISAALTFKVIRFN